jgi:hypothetical protein
MNNETWIPGEGWITFGRHFALELPEYVPVSDPNPRSPYHIPAQHVPVEAAAEPVPEPVLTPGERAKAWLAAELAEGEPVASVGLLERAQKAGITLSTLRRMAKAMGIRKVKQGLGGWGWAMPDEGE